MSHQDWIVNGEKYPSATELTQLLPKGWLFAYKKGLPYQYWGWYPKKVKKHGWRGWLKCVAASNRGKKIGTEVHSLIESFINKEPYVPSGKYESQMFADALYDAVNPLVEEYVAIEPHLVSEKLKLHGTADMIVRMELTSGLWVGDWKTAANQSEDHPIQLAIYAMLWNESHPDQQIDQGFIARVDKKSKRLGVKIDRYAPLSQYFPVVLALCEIYRYMNPPKAKIPPKEAKQGD